MLCYVVFYLYIAPREQNKYEFIELTLNTMKANFSIDMKIKKILLSIWMSMTVVSTSGITTSGEVYDDNGIKIIH